MHVNAVYFSQGELPCMLIVLPTSGGIMHGHSGIKVYYFRWRHLVDVNIVIEIVFTLLLLSASCITVCIHQCCACCRNNNSPGYIYNNALESFAVGACHASYDVMVNMTPWCYAGYAVYMLMQIAWMTECVNAVLNWIQVTAGAQYFAALMLESIR